MSVLTERIPRLITPEPHNGLPRAFSGGMRSPRSAVVSCSSSGFRAIREC